MKKLLSSSIISMLASLPAFAAPSLTCDASGIGATTPNARMKASWSPTVYNIEWYDEDGTQLTVQNSAQSCSYGNTLVLPSTNPTKVGYTFIGWEMETAGFDYGPICDDATEAAFTEPALCTESPNNTDVAGCLDLISGGECVSNGNIAANAPSLGITEPGQWSIEFTSGNKIIGASVCSSTHNDAYPFYGAPTNINSDGPYCWCGILGYKLSKAENTCAIYTPIWNLVGVANCATDCAYRCLMQMWSNQVQRCQYINASYFNRPHDE